MAFDIDREEESGVSFSIGSLRGGGGGGSGTFIPCDRLWFDVISWRWSLPCLSFEREQGGCVVY